MLATNCESLSVWTIESVPRDYTWNSVADLGGGGGRNKLFISQISLETPPPPDPPFGKGAQIYTFIAPGSHEPEQKYVPLL